MQLPTKVSLANGELHLSLEPLRLELRNPFGTSHSSTTERHNGLVTVRCGGRQGLGEAGLPPKKRGVYHADFEDCVHGFQALAAAFATARQSAAMNAGVPGDGTRLLRMLQGAVGEVVAMGRAEWRPLLAAVSAAAGGAGGIKSTGLTP